MIIHTIQITDTRREWKEKSIFFTISQGAKEYVSMKKKKKKTCVANHLRIIWIEICFKSELPRRWICFPIRVFHVYRSKDEEKKMIWNSLCSVYVWRYFNDYSRAHWLWTPFSICALISDFLLLLLFFVRQIFAVLVPFLLNTFSN